MAAPKKYIDFDDLKIKWIKQQWAGLSSKHVYNTFFSKLYNRAITLKKLTENQWSELEFLLKKGMSKYEAGINEETTVDDNDCTVLSFTQYANKYTDDIKTKWDSVGKYVDYIGNYYNNDERFKQIVGEFLPHDNANLVVSVNKLVPLDQQKLVKKLKSELMLSEDYHSAEEFKQDIKQYVTASKWGFNSFLKVLSALGIEELKNDTSTYTDFYLYYTQHDIDYKKLIVVLERFKSLQWAKTLLTDADDSTKYGIYFGIINDLFEYGIVINDKNVMVGNFKMSNQNINYILEFKHKVTIDIRKELTNLSFYSLRSLNRIKGDFDTFEPTFYHQKTKPTIKDKTVMVSYYCTDLFKQGKLIEEDFKQYKNDFINWVLSKSWGKKTLISVIDNNMWIQYSVKLK